MARLTCIIADDEPLALQLLRELVGKLENVEIQASCSNGYQVLAAVADHTPDLMFLDIEMPGLSGFDVVKRLQPEVTPLVIFTTAYGHYAIEAFDVNAVDYVMKPLSLERLRLALERARFRLAGKGYIKTGNKSLVLSSLERVLSSRKEPFLASLGPAKPQQRRAHNEPLTITDSSKTHLVRQDDIDWVDAAGDYMCLHVGDQTLVIRSTMKDLETRLDPSQFARIHRSTLVNVNRIATIKNIGKGDSVLYLEDGNQLRLSRNYRLGLLDLLP